MEIRIAARSDLAINLVPVDFVVRAMWHVAQARHDHTFIVHIAHDTPVALSELFALACRTLGVAGISLVDPQALWEKPLTMPERVFNQRVQFQAPYLLESPLFDTSSFRRLVPRTVLLCPTVDDALLARVNQYCSSKLE